MNKYISHRCLPIAAFALLFVAGGCSGLRTKSDRSWLPNPLAKLTQQKADRADEAQAKMQDAASFAVLWKDSVYEKPGAPSVRGFGGRVFLYDANNQPVRSDGELIVYGFEDKPTATEESGADKKFVFHKSDFQSHFSETSLGASYSVWIPWEKMGGLRKSITLIPVFKTDDGRLLRCGQSINVLPGKKPVTDESQVAHADGSEPVQSKSANLVAQASFNKPAKPNQAQPDTTSTSSLTPIKKSRVRTTTISVPPSLSKKMSAVNQRVPNVETNQPTQTRPTSTPRSESATAAPANESKSKPPTVGAKIFGLPGSF